MPGLYLLRSISSNSEFLCSSNVCHSLQGQSVCLSVWAKLVQKPNLVMGVFRINRVLIGVREVRELESYTTKTAQLL